MSGLGDYWPRRSPGLPPGQRLLARMPRFTDAPLSVPPDPGAELRLTVSVNRELLGVVTSADLERLGPEEHQADFHCVTTWSVRGLRWTGVPLHVVMRSLGLGESTAPYVVARAADHRRGHFTVTDALAPDVLLVTGLDGRPLGARHGAPLRLVAPQHYGYKSIKHLVSLDFRDEQPRRLGLEHLRGRVAFEERHPRLRSGFVRVPYRLLIPPTAYLAERTMRRAAAD